MHMSDTHGSFLWLSVRSHSHTAFSPTSTLLCSFHIVIMCDKLSESIFLNDSVSSAGLHYSQFLKRIFINVFYP